MAAQRRKQSFTTRLHLGSRSNDVADELIIFISA
jgi:hypothetical protein